MTTIALPPPRDWLLPLRQALNGIQIRSSRTAHLICGLIPSRCPFERTFYVGKRKVYIPPLCRLNPLYNEVIALRMRALEYLTALDVDVSVYLEA